MKKLTFDEFCDLMQNKENTEGVIVFKNVWDKKYSLTSRSYKVSSNSKYFKPYMHGQSLFGTNLDGTDTAIRLDWYMAMGAEPRWIVDYCYLTIKG